MKIDRMIGILSILLQKKKVTAPYLAEKFEVSRRTINRDIEQLCMAGIPLVTEQGYGGGISIMDGYNIDRTLLTSSDMQAILAGLRSLDSASSTNRYLQLMEKLSAGASNLLAGDQHILINLSSWYQSSLPPKIELIHAAIDCAKLISFTYYAPKSEGSRTVEPYNLIFQWSNWYLWGYCLKRQDFRLFKLNRMTNLNAGDSFKKRPVSVPDLSQEKIFPYCYQVKAVVSPEHKWKLIEYYGPDCFTVQADGSLLFEFGFTDEESIISWVLAFGNEAELLEPKKLRKNLLEIGEYLQKKYSGS